MPYQFVLGTPIHRHTRTGHCSSGYEYFSDQADRGDVPNLVRDEVKAKRFESQAAAAAAIPSFLAALDHMAEVFRRSMGQTGKFVQQQNSSPIYIHPVDV